MSVFNRRSELVQVPPQPSPSPDDSLDSILDRLETAVTTETASQNVRRAKRRALTAVGVASTILAAERFIANQPPPPTLDSTRPPVTSSDSRSVDNQQDASNNWGQPVDNSPVATYEESISAADPAMDSSGGGPDISPEDPAFPNLNPDPAADTPSSPSTSPEQPLSDPLDSALLPTPLEPTRSITIASSTARSTAGRPTPTNPTPKPSSTPFPSPTRTPRPYYPPQPTYAQPAPHESATPTESSYVAPRIVNLDTYYNGEGTTPYTLKKWPQKYVDYIDDIFPDLPPALLERYNGQTIVTFSPQLGNPNNPLPPSDYGSVTPFHYEPGNPDPSTALYLQVHPDFFEGNSEEIIKAKLKTNLIEAVAALVALEVSSEQQHQWATTLGTWEKITDPDGYSYYDITFPEGAHPFLPSSPEYFVDMLFAPENEIAFTMSVYFADPDYFADIDEPHKSQILAFFDAWRLR